MASFRSAFPSKYLKVDDVIASPVGTIASVDLEDIGADKESKLVAHFVEPSLKPLILNLTNCDSISEISGTDDYSKWPGTKVQLFASKTQFQGRRVPCIRLSAPQAIAKAQPVDVTSALVPAGEAF